MIPFTLVHADIVDALSGIPDATFDAIIADAPYGLDVTKNNPAANWDKSSIAFDRALWAELRRVTRPGGTLAAFGHPKTAHRQTVALEDAGWQIMDTVAWVKSHSYQAGNRSLETELRKTAARPSPTNTPASARTSPRMMRWNSPPSLNVGVGKCRFMPKGPTSNDAAKIGTVLLGQFEGARSFADLDAATERIIRAELTRVGITAGATASRPHFADPSVVTLVVPVTLDAAEAGI